MSKTLNKYIASFGYFHKSLIVLSVTTGSISITSFAAVIAAPVGIVSASYSLSFYIFTGIVKKLLKTTRNKKKHNKIVRLAISKLNSIGSKTSEAFMNSEISHEDFITIINEEKKYRESYLSMSSYCLKCIKNTEKIDPRVLKANNGKTVILSKRSICGSK